MIDAILAKIFGTKHEREIKAMRPMIAAINDLEPRIKELTDAELAAHFDANKDKYRIPEQHKIKFVRIETADVASKIKVPREDVERYYTEHLGQYTTPEQIRASHILLKTEGKNDADVKAKAEGIVKEAKAGGDRLECY